MKLCNKCQYTFDIKYFGLCKKNKEGRKHMCKICVKEYNTKYNEKYLAQEPRSNPIESRGCMINSADLIYYM